METKRKKISTQAQVSSMVEDIVGCKWSLSVLNSVRNNNIRPGEIQRSIDGISTKVLNERLSKMVRYGILAKDSYSEIPPRVEYHFTEFGNKFIALLDHIEKLQSDLSNQVGE